LVIQTHDLTARWRSLLLEQYSEDLHHVEVSWPDRQSLDISYRDIENFDPEFAERIISEPDENEPAANEAAQALMRESGANNIIPFIRIVDLPPDSSRTVRQLRADDIGNLIALEAIVTKISGVRPRIYQAAFICSSCGNIMHQGQPNEQELIEPLECSEIQSGCGRKNKRETRFTLLTERSVMINSQFIELQELPEQIRGGVQPERILCIAEHDLAGNLNPGDRVVANGVLFVRSQRKGGKDTPIFDIFLRLHSIERQNIPLEEVSVSEDEIHEIKELAARDDLYELMSGSIAPSIFGYERVKETMMLQLFGGVARRNTDGTRSRGDIHILLMGDPGVAKSQLLSYMADISPRGRFTSGLSASAAGLTAAAVQDSTADGRWTLEAGALALADLGVAAIDEFDKMNESDRSSMHEAMEQQRISISKAGINATLRTRCAVLAAANPKSGRFQALSEIPFTSQINLAPPLISRFDVVWLMTDQTNPERDTSIANHIIASRFEGVSELMIEQGSSPDPTRTADAAGVTLTQEGKETVARDLIRKYVAYAKRSIHPQLDDEARDAIVAFYVETRKQSGESTDSVAITARALEALTRMAEASARMRLSDIANIKDAERAIRLTRTWRYELMGENFDWTTVNSGQKPKARNAERTVMELIRKIKLETREDVELEVLLNEAARLDIANDKVMDIIEKLNRDGEIYRPRHDRIAPN